MKIGNIVISVTYVYFNGFAFNAVRYRIWNEINTFENINGYTSFTTIDWSAKAKGVRISWNSIMFIIR